MMQNVDFTGGVADVTCFSKHGQPLCLDATTERSHKGRRRNTNADDAERSHDATFVGLALLAAPTDR